MGIGEVNFPNREKAAISIVKLADTSHGFCCIEKCISLIAFFTLLLLAFLELSRYTFDSVI